MFGLDPFSRPVAIAEMLLLLSLAAFVGWLLGRLVLNGRIKALRAAVADKEAELTDCRRSKTATVPTSSYATPRAEPVIEIPVAYVPTDPLLPASNQDNTPSPSVDSPGVDSPGRPEGGTFYGDSDTDEQQNVTFRCETCTGKIKLALTRSTEDYSFERDTKIDGQKRFFPYDIPLPPGEYRLKYFQNDILQIQSTFTVKSGQANTVVVK